MNYTISEILEIQKKLQNEYKKLEKNENDVSFINNKMIDENKVKDGILLLVKECMEVLDEFNYKSAVVTKKELNKHAILIEMIDVFKFWLNIMLYLNFNENDICKAFDEKTIINYEKIKEQIIFKNDQNFKKER